MTWTESEPRFPGPLVNTLPTRPMSGKKGVYSLGKISKY